ncbi:MAG: histidine--tRNA ligase [Pseudomonadales bacterium]
MSQTIKAIRGMQDLMPERKRYYRKVEDAARSIFSQYGFQEVGLPILESTPLFKRLVGEATDIVEKEMYTFDDRNGDSMTLRPEGTAGLVRFVNEHGLAFNQTQKLWYAGPMFRYERPQKGRYRQFEQIGVECIGLPGPDVDAELLLMCRALWQALGIEQSVRLELNSIGDVSSRRAFIDALVAYLSEHVDALDEDSRRRLETNPLRILDSKSAQTQALLKEGPKLEAYLDADSANHFEALCAILDAAQMSYVINRQIVRGLDYYNRTVFEWITDDLGAQGTVCGGGRYDALVGQLGGRDASGVGFAMGVDRLALMLEQRLDQDDPPHVYAISVGESARTQVLLLAEQLRHRLGARVIVHLGAGKLKAQMKKADASGAPLALIVAEDELAAGEVSLRDLRNTGDQQRIKATELVEAVAGLIS